MDKNIIKVKKDDLVNLTGNFLYEDNDELYFSNKLEHSIFELNNDKNYDKTQNYSMNFDDYIQKFMEICSKVKNKPSLIFLNYVPKNTLEILNGEKRNYGFLTELESDEDFEKLNYSPYITCVQTGCIDVLKRLVETRSENIPQNDVFVFFNEPEQFHNLRIPNLETVVSVSKSRRIYCVFNFVNSANYIQEYGPESYKTIKDYCKIKFICNSEGIVDIQPN